MVVLHRRHEWDESSGRLGLRGQRRERQQCDDGSDDVSYHEGGYTLMNEPNAIREQKRSAERDWASRPSGIG
jgi:hypothetical protein